MKSIVIGLIGLIVGWGVLAAFMFFIEEAPDAILNIIRSLIKKKGIPKNDLKSFLKGLGVMTIAIAAGIGLFYLSRFIYRVWK